MNKKEIRRIFRDTDYTRIGGTEEELRAAEYLRDRCEALGAAARIEPFAVAMGDVHEAHLLADGREIPCRGYRCCGSGEVEGPFLYLPETDPVSVRKARGKIVLLDAYLTHFVFQDLMDNGVKGIITYDGDVHYRDRDIDLRELRSFVACGKKLLCVNINAKDALALVKNGVKTVRLSVRQDEYEGQSRNVVAELPGESDEWITLSAHYDSTPLSRGAYDNMSGCVGLLYVLDKLRSGAPHRCGLRFVFCGSEERGLLGSKAYADAHEKELEQAVLNINLDMIGSAMGKFIACATAEDKLPHYLGYMGAELGFPVEASTGVYSSDSTSFADKGVPALSLARLASEKVAPIHVRYDRQDVLSMPQLAKDCAFITELTRRMACAALCPVARTIPEKLRRQIDEYLYRKRKGE